MIAFGFGHGPYDGHQIRAFYLETTGDSPCRDIAFELNMQRRIEEAMRQQQEFEEQERLRLEAEAAAAEEERLRIEAQAEAEAER